jgi:hypothetical protein
MAKKVTDPFSAYGESLEGRSLFEHDPTTQVWIDAIRDIDKDSDSRDLVGLLRSNYPMTDAARQYLADLINRRQLKRKKGRQKTPAYTESEVDQRVFLAEDAVEALVEGGDSVLTSLAKVSKDARITEGSLVNARAGKRGAARRLKSRLKKRFP